MQGKWLTRLVQLAKRHKLLFPFVVLLVWTGHKLTLLGEAVRRSVYTRNALARVASLSLALLMVVPLLPAEVYHMEALPQPASASGEALPETQGDAGAGEALPLGDEGTQPPASLPAASEPAASVPENTEPVASLPASEAAPEAPQEPASNVEPVESQVEESAPQSEVVASEAVSSSAPDSSSAEAAPAEPALAPMDGGLDDLAAVPGSYTITGFAPLGAEVLAQVCPVGTPEASLRLPGKLTAEVTAADGESSEQKLEVRWEATPAYDAEVAGEYVFAPVLPALASLAAGVKAPVIGVVLEEDEAELGVMGGDVIFVSQDAIETDDDTVNDGSKALPFYSLKKAVDAVDSGGTVFVDGAVTVKEAVWIGDDNGVVTKEVTISSAKLHDGSMRDGVLTSAVPVVDNKANMIDVFSDCRLTLNSLTLNGRGSPVAGASVSSLLYATAATTTVNNCILQNNSSPYGGAITVAGGRLDLNDGTAITGNSATGQNLGSSPDIEHVAGGGVFVNNGGVVSLNSSSSITGNTAVGSEKGGGVYVGSWNGSFILNGGSVTGNTATVGNDVYGCMPIDSAGWYAEVVLNSGKIGTSAGGLYSDKNCIVTVMPSFVAPSTIYSELTDFTKEVARFGAWPGADAAQLVADRFLSTVASDAVGFVSSEKVSGSYVDSVKLTTNTNYMLQQTVGDDRYKTSFHNTFNDALGEPLPSGGGDSAVVTVRNSGLTNPATQGGTGPLTLLAASTVLRSLGSGAYDIPIGDGSGTLFTLGSGKTLTVENVNLDFKGTDAFALLNNSSAKLELKGGSVSAASATTAITATAGTVDFGVCTMMGNIAVGGGTVNQTGGTLNGSYTVTAGTVNQTAGTISGGYDVSGSGVARQSAGEVRGTYTLSGGQAFITGTARVTGAAVGNVSGGSLTMQDTMSVAGGFAVTGGTVTQNGGTVATGYTVSGPASTVVNLNGGTVEGTLTINGGTVTQANAVDGTGLSSPNRMVQVAGGSYTLNNGGTITGPNDSTVVGLHVTNGTASVAGGTISGNNIGVYVSGAAGFEMSGGSITGNNGRGMQVVNVSSGVVVSGGSITANLGGGVDVASTAFTLGSGAQVTGNIASNIDGAGIYITSGSCTLEDGAQLAGNTTNAGNGGGVYVKNGGQLMLEGTLGGSTGNSAVKGGGIYLETGSTLATNGTAAAVKGNTATGQGGGVFVAGGVHSFAGIEISGNTATNEGGGVYTDASLTLGADALISGNSAGADEKGGGVYLGAGTVLTLDGGVVAENNTVARDGGKTAHIELGSNFSTATTVMLAEASIVPDTQFYHGITAPDDWLVGAMPGSYDKAEVAPCFKAKTTSDVLLGVYDGVNDWMLFMQIKVELLIPNGSGNDQYWLQDVAAAFTKADAVEVLGSAVIVVHQAPTNNITAITMGANLKDVTLKTSGSTPLELPGAAFTLGSGQTLRTENVEFSGAAAGSLFTVNGGTLVLGEDTVVARGAANTDGAIVKATGGTVQLNSTGIGDYTQSGGSAFSLDGATLKLVKGNVQGLAGDTFTVDIESMVPASASVTMAAPQTRGHELSFLAKGSLTPAQLEAAAPRFSAQDSAEAGIVLRGSLHIDSGNQQKVVWDAVLVELKIGAASPTGHFTVKDAVATLAADAGSDAATITLLSSMGTVGVTLPARDVTLVGGGGTRTLTRAEAGAMITVPEGAELTVASSVILDGKSTDYPGNTGPLLKVNGGGTPGEVTLNGCTLQNNKGGNGGALLVDGGTASAAAASFTGNKAAFGGAVYVGNNGAFTATGGSFTQNQAAKGGAVYLHSGDVTLTNAAISQNSAQGADAAGGGVLLLDGTLELDGTSLSNNTAASLGGGLAQLGGSAELTGFALTGNEAAAGGGIHQQDGSLALEDVTLTGNKAGGQLTTGGSALHNLAGTLAMAGKMQVGDTLLDNNMLAAVPVSIGTGGLHTDALVHVGGDVKAGTIATSPAATADAPKFRHVVGSFENTDTLRIGKQNGGNDIIWGESARYTVTWDNAGNVFTLPSAADTSDILYLIVDGVKMEAGSSGNTYKVTGTGPYQIEFNTPQAPNPSQKGREVLLAMTYGYGGGNSRPIEVARQGEPVTKTYHTTLELAETAITDSVLHIVTLYADLVIDGGTDNAAVLLDSSGPVLLRSQDGKVHTITRDSTPDILLDVVAGTQLTLQNVELVGATGIAGNKSLLRVGTGSAATLGSGAVLRDNETDGVAGGAVYIDGGSFTLNGGTVQDNSADSSNNGGGIFMQNGTLTLNSGIIRRNKAASGGGIYTAAGVVNAPSGQAGVSLLNNEADVDGGGALFTGTATLANITVKDNTAGNDGGGIWYSGGGMANAKLTLQQSEVSGNEATAAGGGLYLADGEAGLNAVLVKANKAASGGGAYVLRFALSILDGSIEENEALAGNGGGLEVMGASALSLASGGGSFSMGGNSLGTAGTHGAGIYLDEDAAMALASGFVGTAPSGDNGPLGNGVYFCEDKPPELKRGFSPATGNLNIEGVYESGGTELTSLDGAILAATPGLSLDDYPDLANIADALRYEAGGKVFCAVAVPKDPTGNAIAVKGVDDVFSGYAYYRYREGERIPYWRFGADASMVPARVVDVALDGDTLTEDADYTLAAGSVVLTLKESYLQTLQTGRYLLAVTLDTDTPGSPSYELDLLVTRPTNWGVSSSQPASSNPASSTPGSQPGSNTGNPTGDAASTGDSGSSGSGSGGSRSRSNSRSGSGSGAVGSDGANGAGANGAGTGGAGAGTGTGANGAGGANGSTGDVQTGDAASPALWVLLLSAALLGVVLCLRRRRRRDEPDNTL